VPVKAGAVRVKTPVEPAAEQDEILAQREDERELYEVMAVGVAAQADEMQDAAGAAVTQYSVGAGQPLVAELHWDFKQFCCGRVSYRAWLNRWIGWTHSTLGSLAEPLAVGTGGGRQDGCDGSGLHGEGLMRMMLRVYG